MLNSLIRNSQLIKSCCRDSMRHARYGCIESNLTGHIGAFAEPMSIGASN